MQTITIGGDLIVNRIGLGTNRIRENQEARALLIGAVQRGVQLIDTADYYGKLVSETVIGEALAPYKPGVVIATKVGMVPGGNGTVNGTPEYLRKAIEGSLDRLRLSCIDLYQLHRVDPNTPLKTTITFLKEMKDAGKIRYIGLSEVTVEQIEAARSILEIASVQNDYNIQTRKHEAVLDYCEANDIAFLPFFPLGHGRIDLQEARITKVAEAHNATVQQIAIAWLLKRSPVMLPIPGTLSLAHLDENLAAAEIELTEEEFVSLS